MENDAGITPLEHAKPMEQPGNPPFAGHPGKGHLLFNQVHPRGHMGCPRFGQPGRSSSYLFSRRELHIARMLPAVASAAQHLSRTRLCSCA